MTSLQNAVSQIRRELGADLVETRAPGYTLAVEPDALDAVRFEILLGQARGSPAAERAQLLRAALALWRGPALADLAGEEFTQGEIRRLEELRLDALEERIAADIELGLHREVIGELETLAARPRCASASARSACSRSTGAAGRRRRCRRFATRAARSSTSSGSSPAPSCRSCTRRSCARRRDSPPPRPGPAVGDVESEILRAVLGGRVVPVIGLDEGGELARTPRSTFDVPADAAGPLGRVTQYVAAMQGLGPLHDELHHLCGGAGEPGPIHRLLARIPVYLRERGAPYQLIVTTAFDGGIERAFADAGEELDVVTYIAAGPMRGRFVHSPPDAEPRTVDVPNAYADLSLERRTVLLRLRGVADPSPERTSRASSSPRTTTSTIPVRASSKVRFP